VGFGAHVSTVELELKVGVLGGDSEFLLNLLGNFVACNRSFLLLRVSFLKEGHAFALSAAVGLVTGAVFVVVDAGASRKIESSVSGSQRTKWIPTNRVAGGVPRSATS
jgi:hypothetical protein